MNFIIKHFNDLTVNELYEISKARFEVFVMDQKIVDEQDYDNKDKECYHVFAYDGDKIVAYSRIVPVGLSYDEASIGRVLVLKEYRRRGIAEKMMRKCIDYIAEELEERKITLSAQNYARGLYEAVGFKAVGEIYEEAGIPHIKMKYSSSEGV